MRTTALAGPAFTRAVDSDDVYEQLGGVDGAVVVVDGDSLPDRLDADATDRLATLPAIVVARTVDPGRRPTWADLVVAPEGRQLDDVCDEVAEHPLASTLLALLLRGGGDRSIAQGLVAESVTYGLLQAGPEFDRWRTSRPVRVRSGDSGPPVLVERHGGCLTVTLNRPHVHNALDAAMRDGIVEALTVAARDPSVTEVRMIGAGDSFCSGGDLDEFGTRSDPVSAHVIRLLASPARSMAAVADRTSVHLHGDVVGSGIELAAFAGRVTASTSTRISLPEVRLGLIPGAGGTVSLPRRIGRHRTLLLALRSDPISADTARQWGLVDDVLH